MGDIGYYLAPLSTVRELPYWGIFPLSAGSSAVFLSVGLRLLVIVEAFCMLYWGILTRAIMMDDFLLVVPFLGDFYISCHTGAYSPIC